jgi:hypothetical protein
VETVTAHPLVVIPNVTELAVRGVARRRLAADYHLRMSETNRRAPASGAGAAMPAALGLLAFLSVSPVRAVDLTPREPALRAGVSFEPDQFHAGLQARIGAASGLRFQPSLDLGFGNSVVLVSLNGDFVYRFNRGKSRFHPYFGGGPGLSMADVTDGVGEAAGWDVDLVGHVIGGVAFGLGDRTGRPRLFFEVRGGFGDTPKVKLTAGLCF